MQPLTSSLFLPNYSTASIDQAQSSEWNNLRFARGLCLDSALQWALVSPLSPIFKRYLYLLYLFTLCVGLGYCCRYWCFLITRSEWKSGWGTFNHIDHVQSDSTIIYRPWHYYPPANHLGWKVKGLWEQYSQLQKNMKQQVAITAQFLGVILL